MADGEVAAEHAAQDRVEEEHRVGAERAVRPARLEEVDRRRRQAAQLDLARDLLDQLVALLLVGLEREAHAAPPAVAAGQLRRRWRLERLVRRRAAEREGHVLDVGRALELVADGADRDPGRLLEREPADAGAERRERDARRADLAGAPIALRTAASITGPLVRRSRSRETAWMTALAASLPRR